MSSNTSYFKYFPEYFQSPKIQLFAKIVNGLKPSTMFAESSFLDDHRILGTIKITRNIGTKRFKSLFTRGFK